MADLVYNEGLGVGSIVVNFQTAGAVILESFTPDLMTKPVLQEDQIGAPLKFALINSWTTASAVAQVPVAGASTVAQGTPTIVLPGDYFTETLTGHVWVVESASTSFEKDNYWKSNLRLRKTTAS